MPRSSGLVATVVLAGLASCVASQTTICGERVCPEGNVCSPDGGRCALPSQLDACATASDGDPCTYAGIDGACAGGVCARVGCGNDEVEAGEACDDGNTESGDGCSSDCKSIESCGNGVEDVGEGCDCGDGVVPVPTACTGPNSNERGANCRTDCQLPGCGDGAVEGLEDCEQSVGTTTCQDLEFYGGTLACSNKCRFDTTGCVGRCGDGVLNGPEECDAAGTTVTSDDVFAGTCLDLGYYVSTGIACTGRCTFDDTGCTGYCGDRDVNGGEPCEGKPQAGATCTAFGYESGAISCSSLCGPDFTDCRATGFALTSVGTTQTLIDAWASGPDDVFVVGAAGTIIRWNGTAWSPMTSSTTQMLRAVWGTGPSDVFAAGDNGTVLRWNGSSWAAMTPSPTTTEVFTGLWGTANDNVYAVTDSGSIFRWNGSSWQSTASGLSGAGGVWGSAANDIYVVGGNGSVVHWNGTAWSAPSLITNGLNAGVFGFDAANVFAYGQTGRIYRLVAGNWTQMTTGTTANILGMWGTGPNDIFAVGGAGTVLHFDGVSWSAVPAGTSQVLFGMWGAGGDAYAVGLNGIVLRKSPAWQAARVASGQNLNDIWGIAANDIFAVGTFGAIQRWNGATWAPMTSGTSETLHGVWGTSGSNMYAVGANGTILRWNGSNWLPETSGTTEGLNEVWGSAANDVFVVGDNGTILHSAGSGSWSPMTSVGTLNINAVWGTGPSNVYAAGTGGLIQRWNGVTWSEDNFNNYFGTQIFGLWGSGPNDIFTVGSFGTIAHWNGSSWAAMSSGTSLWLNGVWGTGPTHAFAVGDGGTILHWNGLAWTPMKSDTTNGMTSVWSTPGGAFVAGPSMTLYRRLESCAAVETVCGDGKDNDCDGRIDCDDSSCASVAACTAGGLCAGYTTITCNSTMMGTTVGGVSLIDRYACDPWLELGREEVYRVARTTAGTIRATLTTAGQDLDLIALGASPSGACDPYFPGCTRASSTEGNELVTFTATANAPYYLVVDGYGASAGSFTLSVTCP